MSRAGTARQLVAEADGGSRGNPGPSGYGALVRDADGILLAEAGERCGLTTNNVAEYSGLVAALTMAAAVDPGARVEVRMDSKLVVEQMSGRWKIKDRRLAGIAAQATASFDPARVRYTWIPRAQNSHADRLANDAMDGRERPLDEAVATLLAAVPRGGRALPPASAGDHAVPPASRRSAAPQPDPAVVEDASAPAGARRPDLGDATTVLLVRHGRTKLTQEKRFSGAGGEDAPLTGTGRGDAIAASLFLSAHDVDAVVVSPLARAQETAGLLGPRLGWPTAVVDDRWAEVAFGRWDGLTGTEVAERDPELFQRWLVQADVPAPGGESLVDLERRVGTALDDLLHRHAGKTVAVVCHMTPIRAVVRRVLGGGPEGLWRLRCAPGSLTVARFWPDGGAEVDGVGLHVPPVVGPAALF